MPAEGGLPRSSNSKQAASKQAKVYVCVCVCVRMYVHTYVYMYVCMYLGGLYVFMYACMYVLYVCMPACMYCMYVCIVLYACMHACHVGACTRCTRLCVLTNLIPTGPSHAQRHAWWLWTSPPMRLDRWRRRHDGWGFALRTLFPSVCLSLLETVGLY